MNLPTWIRTEIYNDVINLREKVSLLQQEGNIIITKEKAYFQLNDEYFEVSFQQQGNTRSRIIAEELNKYKEDLIRFEINPPEEIMRPYDENEDTSTKLTKLYLCLQQRRVARDRIKTLMYYYLIGSMLDRSGQQYLSCLMVNENQLKKIKFKANRTYQLFKNVGSEQIYNTKYLSVGIITNMGKEQFEELLDISVSQELNA